jgi:hypothetical protein
MELKKTIGIVLFLAGATLFYAAYTVGATEALSEWMIRNVPNMKDQYSAKELLMAWGGMLAGLGGIIGLRKK